MRRIAARRWRLALRLSLVAMGGGAAATAARWDGVADGAAGVAWALLGLGAVGGLLAGGRGGADPAIAEQPT